jgi:hypothetical protein
MTVFSIQLATTLIYDIRSVAEVKPNDHGVGITFRDGSAAYLESSHPNFHHLLWIVQWSRSGRALGLVVDGSGQILDLNSVHDTSVHWVREFPTDRTRIAVAFWAYSPVCGLTRDHPDFERIHTTLTEAVGTSQLVWVATHSEEVVDDEPDKDGLQAALPKILDVRLACSTSNGKLEEAKVSGRG